MLTISWKKTRTIWVFTTESKQTPVPIISFILKELNNEKHPWKHARVDDDGVLENSTDATNLLVYELIIATETTSGDASRINGNNERHNIRIHTMFRSNIITSNKNWILWEAHMVDWLGTGYFGQTGGGLG